MPEVKVTIGGRGFDVACQVGEEHFLRTAAALLDAEATVLIGQIGRLPEVRMLLMAGLMLADKTAGMADQIRALQAQLAEVEARIATAEREIEAAQANPLPAEPVLIEVPVVPEDLSDVLAALAAQAEALAERVEEEAGL